MHSFKKKLLTSVSALFLSAVTFSGAANASARVEEFELKKEYTLSYGTTPLKISAAGANGRQLDAFFKAFDENYEKDEAIVKFSRTGASKSPSPTKVEKIDEFKEGFHLLIKFFADKLVSQIVSLNVDKKEEIFDHLKTSSFVGQAKKAEAIGEIKDQLSTNSNPFFEQLSVVINGVVYRPFYKTMSIAVLAGFAGDNKAKAKAIYQYLSDATVVFQDAVTQSIKSHTAPDQTLHDLEEELRLVRQKYNSHALDTEELLKDIGSANLRIKELEAAVQDLERAALSTTHELVEAGEAKAQAESHLSGTYIRGFATQLRIIQGIKLQVEPFNSDRKLDQLIQAIEIIEQRVTLNKQKAEEKNSALLEDLDAEFSEKLETVTIEFRKQLEADRLENARALEELKRRFEALLQKEKEQVQALDESLELQKTENKRIAEELERKESELKEAREENVQIRHEFAQKKLELEEALSESQQKESTTGLKLKTANELAERQRLALEEAERTKHKLETDAFLATEKVKSLEIDRDFLHTTIAQKEKSIKRLEKAKTELEQESAEEARILQGSIDRQTLQIEALKRESQEKTDEIEEGNAEILKLTREKASLEQEKLELVRQLQESEEKAAEFERLSIEAGKEISLLEDALRTMTVESDAKDLKKQELERKLQKKRVAKQDLILEHQRQLALKQQEVEDKDRQLVAEQQEVVRVSKELRKATKTGGDKDLEKQELERKLQKKRVAKQDLIREHQRQLVAKQQEVDDKQHEVEDKDRQLAAEQQEVVRVGLALQAKKDEKKQLKRDHQRQVADKDQEIFDRDQEIIRIGQEVHDKDQEILRLGREVHDRDQEIIRIGQEVHNKDQEIIDQGVRFQQQLALLQQQILALQGQIPQPRVFTAEEDAENKKWQEPYDALTPNTPFQMYDGSFIIRDSVGGVTRKINKTQPFAMSWHSSFKAQGKTAPSIVLADGTRL